MSQNTVLEFSSELDLHEGRLLLWFICDSHDLLNVQSLSH